MKPDWKDAPEWAQWCAKDADGQWWWHESKPAVFGNEWMGPVGSFIQKVPDTFWEKSLQQRQEAV